MADRFKSKYSIFPSIGDLYHYLHHFFQTIIVFIKKTATFAVQFKRKKIHECQRYNN